MDGRCKLQRIAVERDQIGITVTLPKPMTSGAKSEGRFGKPEDIVYLAMYLASDESAWTNGAAIVVDGGITSNYF